MSENLQAVHEAITLVKEDRDEVLRLLRPVLRSTGQAHVVEQWARLEADIHELDLLRRRELCLIESGRESEGGEA